MLLEFPFNHDMYDKGYVVRMLRSELVELVLRAAGRADVSDEVAANLVAAVGRYSTATVAVGAYQRSIVPGCQCPASLAGYVQPKVLISDHHHVYLTHDDEVGGFPGAFDSIMYRRYPRAMVIEVVND